MDATPTRKLEKLPESDDETIVVGTNLAVRIVDALGVTGSTGYSYFSGPSGSTGITGPAVTIVCQPCYCSWSYSK